MTNRELAVLIGNLVALSETMDCTAETGEHYRVNGALVAQVRPAWLRDQAENLRTWANGLLTLIDGEARTTPAGQAQDETFDAGGAA